MEFFTHAKHLQELAGVKLAGVVEAAADRGQDMDFAVGSHGLRQAEARQFGVDERTYQGGREYFNVTAWEGPLRDELHEAWPTWFESP